MVSVDLPVTAWQRNSLVLYRGTVYVIWGEPNGGGRFILSYPETPGMPVLWSIPWELTTPI